MNTKVRHLVSMNEAEAIARNLKEKDAHRLLGEELNKTTTAIMGALKPNPMETLQPVAVEWLGIDGAARHLGVSIHTVKAWRKRGKFPPAARAGRLPR